MNKNYKKSFSKKRIDKKELLLYALNILNFDLIRSEKELLKNIFLLAVHNFDEVQSKTLLKNFIVDERIFDDLNFHVLPSQKENIAFITEAIDKGLKENETEFKIVTIDIEKNLINVSFTNLMKYLFKETSRLKFSSLIETRVNRLNFRKAYENVIPCRNHFVYSCEFSLVNFIKLSKLNSAVGIFIVENRIFIDSVFSLNFKFLKAESEIPFRPSYKMIFINSAFSSFEKFKELKQLSDNTDMLENLYINKFQELRLNYISKKKSFYQSDLIEVALKESLYEFLSKTGKPYSGSFRVFLPDKKITLFACDVKL